jgi:outer membrane protein assembly factor BamB
MQSRSWALITIGSISFASLTPLLAADWPQWRGPHRDGSSVEEGLLKEWPTNGPALLWKTNGFGQGYSSIAIAGGSAYTMGTRGDSECVFALDLATQRELWAAKVGPIFTNGTGNGPRCTPAVDGGMVFALGAGAGDLLCLDAATGKEVWRRSLPKDFGGKMQSMWGWSESPLVDGGRVVCSPGARDAVVVALDRRTGATIWKAALPESVKEGQDGAGYASCVVSAAGGIRQYVAFTGRGPVGVAAQDGKFLWSSRAGANDVANCTTPIVSGDYVFVSSAYDIGSALIELTPDAGGIKAETVYTLDAKTFANHHGGVALVGDYLYGGHGHNDGLPTCIEFKTGKIVWRAETSPGRKSAAVIYADSQLYFRFDNGVVALIDATPDGYRLRGTFNPGSTKRSNWAHPAIGDGRLYIREGDALSCFDVRQKP